MLDYLLNKEYYMNTSPNNSVLVNKLIKLGVTDPDKAEKIIMEYMRTGKIVIR